MKKNILVLFLNRKDIASIAKAEVMVHSLLDEMARDGKDVVKVQRDTRCRTYTFSDGSRLMMNSFGVNLHGMRITHLYVDQDALNLADGKRFVEEHAVPFLMSASEMYVEYDVADDFHERVKTYDFTHNKSLKTFPYYKD
jgi:hypothetical protein